MGKSVAIAITTFRNPLRLEKVLRNMLWSGLPDVPVYVFQDLSPFDDAEEMTSRYYQVQDQFPWIRAVYTPVEWRCMQGIIQHAMDVTHEDWIIYVPDDVAFTRGGLWNEYAGVLAYGRDWVGGIQAPYWNRDELSLIAGDEGIWDPRYLERVQQNPHWDGKGVPRKYINLNGAGFSINRRLWKDMGGWPQCTWRLDEYAGYMAWKLGYAIITLPGPPRVHMLGGSTPLQPPNKPGYETVEAWQEATGGKTPEQTGLESREVMNAIPECVRPDGCFNDLLEHFGNGRGSSGGIRSR